MNDLEWLFERYLNRSRESLTGFYNENKELVARERAHPTDLSAQQEVILQQLKEINKRIAKSVEEMDEAAANLRKVLDGEKK